MLGTCTGADYVAEHAVAQDAEDKYTDVENHRHAPAQQYKQCSLQYISSVKLGLRPPSGVTSLLR